MGTNKNTRRYYFIVEICLITEIRGHGTNNSKDTSSKSCSKSFAESQFGRENKSMSEFSYFFRNQQWFSEKSLPTRLNKIWIGISVLNFRPHSHIIANNES